MTKVFKEDETVHGSFTPGSWPLAIYSHLTETGDGSLDLRRMKMKESECEG